MKTQQDGQYFGLVIAMSAFGIWGLMPIFFKYISHVDALEIVTHRVLWSVVFGLALVVVSGQIKKLKTTLCNLRQLRALALSAVLISCNWLIFVWAVVQERILDASLGYYINPLMNMLLGYLVLGERITPWQKLAAGIACSGVLVEVISFGSWPWIALSLAFSFGVYGLLKKKIAVESHIGLLVETLLILPWMLIFLYWMQGTEFTLLSGDIELDSLLILSGPLTMLPLILFTMGARRITLTALGFVQYIGPSLMFITALFYGEQITVMKIITFSCIWSALLLVMGENLLRRRALYIKVTPK